mgnify:CR=1 FL=1
MLIEKSDAGTHYLPLERLPARAFALLQPTLGRIVRLPAIA